MWNGGHMPYGYERKNKKLIINKIYQGIHQPIISEEFFEIVQKTHKRRIRKFRIYKYFLLGGLIPCKECGYTMSACFANKHRKEKLKRYYYYRCARVTKNGWQACSIKEVSAERIENYILENLERISFDKNYLENLVFKLNHNLLLSRLKRDLKEIFLLKDLSNTLSIIYSKETSKLTYFIRKILKIFGQEKAPPASWRAGRKFRPKVKKIQFSLTRQSSCLKLRVPGEGLEPSRRLSLQWVLSPLCLPIPTPGQNFEARMGFAPMSIAFAERLLCYLDTVPLILSILLHF